MILYADASAIVKRYVAEFFSDRTERIFAQATHLATCIVSRAEVAAALAGAARMGAIPEAAGRRQLAAFSREWPHFIRLPVTESTAERAQGLAWEHGLRGHEALHLAAAVDWSRLLGRPVAVATFDQQLWDAAPGAGLERWPTERPVTLAR